MKVTQGEQETVNNIKSWRKKGWRVSLFFLSKWESFKWIRPGRKNRRAFTINNSDRSAAPVLMCLCCKLFIGNKEVRPWLLSRSLLKLHAFILPDMRLNRPKLKSRGVLGVYPTNLGSSTNIHPAEVSQRKKSAKRLRGCQPVVDPDLYSKRGSSALETQRRS